MSLLGHLCEDPNREILALLRADDVGNHALDLDMPEANPDAVREIRDYVSISSQASRKIVLHELVKRFMSRPYGWPEREVILLVTRLFVAGEMQFVSGAQALKRDQLQELLTVPSKWRSITLMQRVTSSPEVLKRARVLGRDVFAEMGPDSEDGLFQFLCAKLGGWQSNLRGFKTLIDNGTYPGKEETEDALSEIDALLVLDESSSFLSRFVENDAKLKDVAEDYHDLSNFFATQKPTWDKLLAAHYRFRLNHSDLERDAEAHSALSRLSEILKASAPYGLLQEVDGLVAKVNAVNEWLLTERRAEIKLSAEAAKASVQNDLAAAQVDLPEVEKQCIDPFASLELQIEKEQSLAHLAQIAKDALRRKDDAIAVIREHVEKTATSAKPDAPKPVIRETEVVYPAKHATKPYLETEADVEVFMSDLRAALSDAITTNKRIEIR